MCVCVCMCLPVGRISPLALLENQMETSIFVDAKKGAKIIVHIVELLKNLSEVNVFVENDNNYSRYRMATETAQKRSKIWKIVWNLYVYIRGTLRKWTGKKSQ